MKKDNFKKFILPILSSNSESCLTTQDIKAIGVQSISCNLESLLIKPGMFLLDKISNFKKYIAWDGNLVLNAANLKLDSNYNYIICSTFDGSKHVYTKEDILQIIIKLSPDILIAPEGLDGDDIKALFSHIKEIFLPIDNYATSKDISSFGVYFEYDDSKKDLLTEFMKNFTDTPKYINGFLSLDLMRDLLNDKNIYFSSNKPTHDGYNGVVYYSNQDENSILNSKTRLDFNVIDSNCHCPTCLSKHTVSYLHHLFLNVPLLCSRFLISHNVFYVGHLR